MAWERLAHVELTGAGDVIDSGTFTAKKNLSVIIHIKETGTANAKLQVNSFTGAGYSHRYSEGGGSDTTGINQNSIRLYETGSGTAVQRTITLQITNIVNKIKLFDGSAPEATATGAGTAPNRVEIAGSFEENPQITSIQIKNDESGSFAAGSYITVLGAKEPATSDTLTVSSFTAKKNLKAQLFAIGTGGTINCNFTFNNDTGSNYAIRESVNGGSDSTNVSQANTDNITGTVTGDIFADVNITNEASKEKLFISEGLESASGAGNAPERKEMVGKWANTSAQITTIKANNGGSGSYSEGSELIVWGSDGASDTTHPTVVNGFILEETDTGKHYIWNATTSTWTEVA